MLGYRSLCILLFLCTSAAFLAGCPQPQGPTRVITLFTADGNLGKTLLYQILAGTTKADVPISDIESLIVTIKGITLDRQADTGVNSVVVFDGAIDVDLLDLQGVSEIISASDVPAGTYTKIRIQFEDPRLVLTSDPETVLTNIQVTANGNLFVSQSFEVPEGQTSLILLDFGGVKLVERGNGDFTLTPQLEVDLSIVNAAVIAQGTIVSVNTTTKTFQLTTGSGEITVDYSSAVLFRANDTDTATGTEADLASGVTVTIDGTLMVDGSIVAAAIRINAL